MKIRNLTTRPGFEFIFAAGIAAIFILPAAVMAQDNKNIEINITNGDTVINGKNIKALSPAQREEALKDLNKIKGTKGGRKEIHIERMGSDNDGLGYADNIVKTPNGYIVEDNAKKQLHLKRVLKDTATYAFKFRLNDGDMKTMDFRGPEGPGSDMNMMFNRGPRVRNMEMRRRGSQSFSYANVDASGVETNVSYRVSDKAYKPLKGDDGPDLTVLPLSDLKLIADFTTGKTQLTFSLPGKTFATAELTDGNGTVLWMEKVVAGSFNKSFAMPLNGHYFLNVKQGSKSASKVIFKQD